jgi:hypothetical protein
LALTGLWNLDALYPGARLITPENFSSTKLWVLPGALHDRLEQAGMLLPPNFPAVLPDSAFRSTLKLVGVGRGADVLRRDTERDVVVSVTHRGSGSPWPPRLGFVSGNGWVRLAVIWLAVSDPRDPVGVGEADLPRTVFPGETVKVTVPLVPRGLDGAPLPPGRYVVRVGLVQDGYVFFSAKGDHTLDFAVSVGRPSAPAVH